MKNLTLTLLFVSSIFMSCGGNETAQTESQAVDAKVETTAKNMNPEVETKVLEELDTIKAKIEKKEAELKDLLNDLDN